MKHETVLVLDFGGQYNQLIARRVRDMNVYCEIKSYKTPIADIQAAGYKGIIFTGGPQSVYKAGSPTCDPTIFELGIPVLGICYGAQLMAHLLGGTVETCDHREYGKTTIQADQTDVLFKDIPASNVVWMSHTDQITCVPEGFSAIAHSDGCKHAAMSAPDRKLYAVQFHPEVNHSEYGQAMLKAFLYDVCGCSGDWKMEAFVEETVQSLKEQYGDSKVLCAFSGGVDSSVAALLLHKAIGHNLTCIFVDHGLLRKDEGDQVEAVFGQHFNLNLKRINCEDRFLAALKGVTDPEKKRKIIGELFIRVFEEASSELGDFDYLAQGTIYPDVVESGVGEAAVIKSHHNVGGLPEHMKFKGVVEPLRNLFKDEVRRTGETMGIPHDLVWRQPFPGPGLAVRIIGELTKEKLALLQDADAIFRAEIAKAKLDESINQYFAVLTDMRSVGVMGDERTYDYTLALRAVTTSDFMTADWARIPYDVLEVISNRIVNEVRHINRIVYDITSKPPATIEWE